MNEQIRQAFNLLLERLDGLISALTRIAEVLERR